METLDSSRGFLREESGYGFRRFGGAGGGGLAASGGGGGAMFFGGGGGGIFRAVGGGGGGLALGGSGLLPAVGGGGAGRVIVCAIAIVFSWSPAGAFAGVMIFTTLGYMTLMMS